MEVNGRFWHSLPRLVMQASIFLNCWSRWPSTGMFNPIAAIVPAFAAAGCWAMPGISLRWKGPPPGYPGTYPGRLRTLLQVLTPVPGAYHDLFQWRDPCLSRQTG